MIATVTVPDLEPHEEGGAESRCDAAMYRRIVETANEGIWQTDAQFRGTFVNDRMGEMLGYTPEDMLGRPIRDFMLPEEIADHQRRAQEHQQGYRDRFERRFRHRDGHTVTVLVSVTSLLDENGVFQGAFAMLTDITERERMMADLRASEARFRSIFELSPLGIVLVSKIDQRFMHANSRYCELLGYTLEELQRMTVADVTHPDDRPQLQQLYRLSSLEKQVITVRKRYLRKDGATRWVNLTADLFLEQANGESLAIGIVEDITEPQEVEERIHHLALYDALTDLPNRVLLQDRLRQAISEARREQTLLALLFLDLDRFKIVNDSLGHTVGDRLLQAVAARLGHHVRGSDTVCRLGGDEFVVVLTAIRDASDVRQVADKLLHSLAEPLVVDGHTLKVSTSIGISLYPMDGGDTDTLLQRADMALYQAKAGGRNNYQFFTVEMNVRARDRLQLEQGLGQALECGEFTLHYQPQIDCVTGRVVAVEALLRWRHPELGWVAPNRFISIAEDSGLMIAIGEWALGKACRDSQTWRRAGFGHGTISFNVSALQLQRAGFSARLAEILRETDLQPGDLELELTENLLIDQANAAALRQLKDMGVVLSIDDFGTGYSNLSHLRRFAIDKLKLDRSFLCDVGNDADAAMIATAIITTAHCLRLAVVAKGWRPGNRWSSCASGIAI